LGPSKTREESRDKRRDKKRAYTQESAKPTLLVSHLYALDHAILTLAHYLFFDVYWYQIPHDGRRTANSQAQIDLINLAASRGEIPPPHSDENSPIGGDGMDGQTELRVALAQEIWKDEKVYAGWALIFGWALKVSVVERTCIGLGVSSRRRKPSRCSQCSSAKQDPRHIYLRRSIHRPRSSQCL
jgi:hypothetical protein